MTESQYWMLKEKDVIMRCDMIIEESMGSSSSTFENSCVSYMQSSTWRSNWYGGNDVITIMNIYIALFFGVTQSTVEVEE